mmetsp:Transcript_4803/g.12301  ORF Transcript_4803/g.12301 Transcript_4803/m.12301 type:complete len:233 (+) Transcript_4803:209-907(+)
MRAPVEDHGRVEVDPLDVDWDAVRGRGGSSAATTSVVGEIKHNFGGDGSTQAVVELTIAVACNVDVVDLGVTADGHPAVPRRWPQHQFGALARRSMPHLREFHVPADEYCNSPKVGVEHRHAQSRRQHPFIQLSTRWGELGGGVLLAIDPRDVSTAVEEHCRVPEGPGELRCVASGQLVDRTNDVRSDCPRGVGAGRHVRTLTVRPVTAAVLGVVAVVQEALWEEDNVDRGW